MGLASQGVATTGNVASTYGGVASGISSSLIPFETRQLMNPSGFSPQDITAQLAALQGGAGGGSASLVGGLNQTAANTNNYGGFGGASDEVARQRMKVAAGGAEGIASDNAQVKLGQQKTAGSVLDSLYGTSVGAQTSALSTQASDIKSAQNEGFMARLGQITGMLDSNANSYSNVVRALGPQH